jgi:hypothetical protein
VEEPSFFEVARDGIACNAEQDEEHPQEVEGGEFLCTRSIQTIDVTLAFARMIGPPYRHNEHTQAQYQ